MPLCLRLITILPDGQHLEGKVVYIDEDLDIALIKVPGENFPHLALADAQTVRQGESVFAIGNPSGAMQFSMTKGIVSAPWVNSAKPALAHGFKPIRLSIRAIAAARWSATGGTCRAGARLIERRLAGTDEPPGVLLVDRRVRLCHREGRSARQEQEQSLALSTRRSESFTQISFSSNAAP